MLMFHIKIMKSIEINFPIYIDSREVEKSTLNPNIPQSTKNKARKGFIHPLTLNCNCATKNVSSI